MDMVGSLNSAAPTVLLEGAAVSQAVIDGLALAASTYTGLAVQTSLNPFNSDHVPFIRKEVPAVLTIEGTDDANHDIHSPRDTLDRINFDLALEILRMNTAFVAGALNAA
jgi:Zn-dependent M28 family amino/carboxypeptidase